VAFDEYCRRNPPKTPEEAQLRRVMGMAIDAHNVAIAAYMDFETALAFVRSLRAAAAGAGGGATATAAASGVALLQAALAWYAHWYVETHSQLTLSRVVGGHSVCFTIERPGGLFEPEHLVITVDGRKLASFDLVRGGQWEPTPRQACLFEWPGRCVDRSASSGGVSVTCRSGIPFVECTVEVEDRVTITQESTYSYGTCTRTCTTLVMNVYRWAWRVRVGLLGLEEVQAPLGRLAGSRRLGEWCAVRCWIEWWPSYSYTYLVVPPSRSLTPPTSSESARYRGRCEPV
jgi:hypothetical protein